MITRLSGIRINSSGQGPPPALSIKAIRVLVINAHNLGIVLAIADNGMYLSVYWMKWGFWCQEFMFRDKLSGRT